MSNFFNIKQALALYGMLYCLGDTFIEEIYISEQEQKECFYNAVKADEIEMDFNDWKNQNFRKALAEMEGIFGHINFSLLQNAKDSKKKKKN